MKRRTLTLTLCILACIALIGVGFASWVITYNKEAEVTGNVDVDTISDQSHVITVVDTTSISNIKFGATKTTISNPWLTVPTEACNLVLTFDVTITNSNSDNLESNPIKVELVEEAVTIGETANQKPYAAAVTANLVGALPTSTSGIVISQKDAGTEDNNYVATYTVTVTFTWGSKFIPSGSDSPVNPTDFYNGQTYTSDLAADALSTLGGETFKNLGSAQFKITVSPNTKTTTSE